MFEKIIEIPLNILFYIWGIIPIHDFGIAVILLTILIRILLWRFAAKQIKSQAEMQKLQPEIKKLQEKYKDDKPELNKQMMQFYKDKDVNAFASCGMALIQMPVLLTMFVAIRRIDNDFSNIITSLYSTVTNLSFFQSMQAGAIEYSPYFLNTIDMRKSSYLLGAIAGIAQFYQMKTITKNKPKDNKNKSEADLNQSIMTSMMYIFPLMTVFIAGTLPAALGLYWIVSSLISIFQQSYTKKGSDGSNSK